MGLIYTKIRSTWSHKAPIPFDTSEQKNFTDPQYFCKVPFIKKKKINLLEHCGLDKGSQTHAETSSWLIFSNFLQMYNFGIRAIYEISSIQLVAFYSEWCSHAHTYNGQI